MTTTTATRRLTAILAADVVGYSRLMGADEEGTHERFKAHLVELVEPKIREHHGRSVKNIARPVRVYALRAKGLAGLPTASVSSTASNSPPVAAPRLSIVVLPFTNLSDDREQQYFADGITEDLTTDLSRLENMFVISRNTAFTYRNKPIDTKQIGRELGVRYVLEGSVRRSGSQLRVSAQL